MRQQTSRGESDPDDRANWDAEEEPRNLQNQRHQIAGGEAENVNLR
jgi:hypothetical protein